jgi:hypothetical protein
MTTTTTTTTTSTRNIHARAGPTQCFVKNDSPFPFDGEVEVSLVHFATGAVSPLGTTRAHLAAGAGTSAFFCPGDADASPAAARRVTARNNADDDDDDDDDDDTAAAPPCPEFAQLFQTAGCANGGADCIMRDTVTSSSSSPPPPSLLLADNVLPLAAPSAFVLPDANVSVAGVVAVDGTTANVTVESTSTGVALYVWLSTLAHGRFSQNGFMMSSPPPPMSSSSKGSAFAAFTTTAATTTTTATVVVVQFLSFGPLDLPRLQSTLRVEHLGQHLKSPF